jgi:sporulation protein YlmC with PRC-barrel domain
MNSVSGVGNRDASAGIIVNRKKVINEQPTTGSPVDRDSNHTFATDSDDFAMARRSQKVTDLMGKNVTNAAGEDLGQIEEIVTDAISGRILYGVLSFGGFLGLGDKYYAIPWQSLRLTDDAKKFTLNVEKDRLKKATGFDKERWPDLANEQFATNTYQQYNQKPYWQSGNGEVQPGGLKIGTSASHRDRWNEHTTAWQKCTDLCDKEVRTTQGDEVGALDDLVLDPDSGRILYGILSYRNKLFAIPWNALTLNTNEEQFVLNANEKQLSNNFSFDNDNWPNMIDQGWAADLYAHYNVEPGLAAKGN